MIVNIICLLFVFTILRTFKAQLSENRPAVGMVKKEKTTLNYWKLVKKPYFMLISLMALLPIFGYLFVDFLFLSQTKREFANNPETIAGFFGIFLGFVAVVELVFKLVSGRFLNKYGLKPSLISLPLILLAGMLLAAVSGTFSGTIGLFFAFVALARLFERSVRAAFYEPAFQLLYQPVPSGQRMIFQNQIEGIPKASGTVITGAVILLFSTVHTFNLVHYSWIFIVVLGIWLVIAFRMYDHYRNMLRSKLDELNIQTGAISDPDAEFIRNSLTTAPPAQMEKVFRILMDTYPVQTLKVLPTVYQELPDQNRLHLLEQIAGSHVVSALQFLKKQIPDPDSGSLYSRVKDTIALLENVNSRAQETIETLTQSANPMERRRAACILGQSGRYDTFRLLAGLMKDPDPLVRRAAIIAGSTTKRTELWPSVIEILDDPRYTCQAGTGLKIIGEPVLNDLVRLFEKSGGSTEAKAQIISVFESVGGARAIKFLRSKMMHPDRTLRKKIHSALGNLNYRASVSEIPGIKSSIEESIETILWLQASLLDLGKLSNAGKLQMAMLDHMEEEKEYVFRMLSLLYDSKTIRHIRENIESKDNNARIYALEMGDMLISDEIKQVFFPLFEDISMQERLQRFENRFPQEQLEPFSRLSDILNRELSGSNYWIKACAIDVLGQLKGTQPAETSELLASCIVHPHFMIGELAAWVLHKTDPMFYIDAMVRLKRNNNPFLSLIAENIRKKESNQHLLLFEKVLTVKNTDLFSDLHELDIVNLLLRYPGIPFEKEYKQNGSTDALPLLSDNGYTVVISNDILAEPVGSSTVFAGKYLKTLSINPNNV